jgi:NAD(P)-dependent dehydrogenase (short-subunit alcohol dehydrogenase family)
MELKSRFDLSGRIVLLTGAGGHLGRAMSRAILEAGGELIMLGRRQEGMQDGLASLDPVMRERCHAVVGDVTRHEDLVTLRDSIQRQFGCLHGIVNNAYAGRVGDIATIDEGDFSLACQYNLIAPFSLVKEMRGLLEEGSRKAGVSSSVVNIGSMYGIVSPDPEIYGDSGQNNPAHYGATKAGLIQLTRYLACHLASSGIRVNCVSPGPFPNTSTPSSIPGFIEKLAHKVPMKRIGDAREIGGPVVFLLSDASSYINGVNLPVDGGWTAW